MDVRTIREQLNITQAQLANRTGIPRDRIAKWEQGKGVPKAEDQKVLEKVLGKNVPTAHTTTTETPQNGQKSGTHEDYTEIGELVNKIQYVTRPKLTIEQIADRIKFSRPHLTTLLKSGESKKALTRLKLAFAKEIAAAPELTTTTNKPVFDVKPLNLSDKDTTIKILSEVTKSQQDFIEKQGNKITEMSSTLINLVSKVIEKL